MANIVAYWKQCNEIAATLPEEVALMSIENATVGTHAGAVCIANKTVASQRLVERTHVLATEEQLNKFLAQQTANVKLAQDRDNRRAPKTVLVVGQEQIQQLVPALAESVRKKSA